MISLQNRSTPHTSIPHAASVHSLFVGLALTHSNYLTGHLLNDENFTNTHQFSHPMTPNRRSFISLSLPMQTLRLREGKEPTFTQLASSRAVMGTQGVQNFIIPCFINKTVKEFQKPDSEIPTFSGKKRNVTTSPFPENRNQRGEDLT